MFDVAGAAKCCDKGSEACVWCSHGWIDKAPCMMLMLMQMKPLVFRAPDLLKVLSTDQTGLLTGRLVSILLTGALLRCASESSREALEEILAGSTSWGLNEACTCVVRIERPVDPLILAAAKISRMVLTKSIGRSISGKIFVGEILIRSLPTTLL